MTDQAIDISNSTQPIPNQPGPLRAGFEEIWQGFSQHRIWTMLAWNDVRQRYRRSVIGPFWITISMAFFIAVLGVIYSKLFGIPIAEHLPYVAMGLITWGFIAATTTEAGNAFFEGAGIIRQIRLPLSVYPLRLAARGFIILLHTIVLYVPIALIFGLYPGWSTLLAFPGIGLLMINQFWVSIVVAVVSTRYRDVVPLIATTMQASMLATPIMWSADLLGGSAWIAEYNPFYHMVQIVRAPLLGQIPGWHSYAVILGMILIGSIVAAYVLGRARNRIVYWI